jgi:hypothetical protein
MAVPLGGSVIQTAWERRLQAVRELLKDFALPLILLLLGGLVSQLDKEREEARQKHDREREEAQQKHDRETQQTHLTWNAMLPETHKLTFRYYMKIQAAAGGIMRDLEKSSVAMRAAPADPKTTELCRSAFFYMVLFYRRIKYFLDHNSGFYFKCPAGEGLVVATYARFRDLYRGADPLWAVRRNIDRMLQHVELNETFDSFLTKLDGSIGIPNSVTQNFKDGWTHFLTWVSSSDCEVALLELKSFYSVLSWELNRPYAYWYGEKPTERYWKDTKETLRKFAEELEMTTSEKHVARDIKEYLETGEPEPSA